MTGLRGGWAAGALVLVAPLLALVSPAAPAQAALSGSTVVYQCGAQVCAIDPDVAGSNRVIATGKPAGVTRDGKTAGFVDSASNIREIPLAAGGQDRLMAAAGENPDFASISGDGGFSSWIWYYGGDFGWSMKVAPPGATNGNQWGTVASSTMQMSVGWTHDDQVLATRRGTSTYDSRICIEQIGGPVCDVLLASESDRSQQTAFPDMHPSGNSMVVVRGPEGTGYGLPYYGQLAIYNRGATSPARILTNGPDAHPEFSNDGSRVVFERQNQGIWVINTDGSGLRKIADGSMPFWGGDVHDTPPANHDPIGSFDLAEPGHGTLRVRGWGFDPDASSTSIVMHVYIGGPAGTPGAESHVIGADQPRPDVNAAHGVSGNHGFDATLTTAKRGPQQVCVYAINLQGGSNPSFGCVTRTIPDPVTPNRDPIGSYDDGEGGAGTVRVRGWTFDPDVPGDSLSVHVYVGGDAGTPGAEAHVISANLARPDVNAGHGVPGDHGFDATLTTAMRGAQPVCVYAIGRPAGNNPSLGCLTLNISGPVTANNPVGALEQAAGLAGAVQVGGWAFDADASSSSVDLHVYIGGEAGSPAAEGHAVDAGGQPMRPNLPRPDVNAAHGIDGNHGYSRQINTAKRGAQQVCVYAINKGGGDNALIGCRTVTIADGTPPAVNRPPVGAVEQAVGGQQSVTVSGWAYDADAIDEALDVTVWIGGRASVAGAERHVVRADRARGDVVGSHGFRAELATAKAGTLPVCVYAANKPGGEDTLLGCHDVTVTGAAPPPAASPPGASLLGVARHRKHAKVLKARVSCAASNPQGCAGRLVIKLRKKASFRGKKAAFVIARGRFDLKPGTKAVVRLKVTRPGRYFLRKRKLKVTIRATNTVPAGVVTNRRFILRARR